MYKFNESSNRELAKAVRNFNNKIKRLEKSERDLILPDKVSVADIKKEIKNKWELNRKLNELRLFSTRGIEKTITTKGGATLSKYEYELIQKEQKRLYDKLSRTIKRIEAIRPTTFGIPEDVTYKQMGSIQLSNLKARREAIGRRNINNLGMRGIRGLVKLLENTRTREKHTLEVFRNNYMDKMLFSLGFYAGYDQDKIKEMRDKMNTLSDRDFMKMFESDLSIQAIKDYYPVVHGDAGARTIRRINEMYDSLYENLDSIIDQYRR